MFGLFQADLPIGNRLWLALLAIVVGGSIAATPLSEVASDPVSFGVNLLLLFGQATFVTTLALLIPSFLIVIIEFEVKRRADINRSEFLLETEYYDPLFDRLFSFLTIAGYVITIFWIADGNFSPATGSVGLALFLFGEVLIEWREVYLKGYEYLELKRVKNDISARIIREENEQKYDVDGDWISLHAYLGDNNWIIIEFSKTYSLHRRSYKKGLIPRRWLMAFPEPLSKLFGKRPIRHRKM